MKQICEEYDVVVVGGGVGGVVAAIAAARNGCKTCLMQDRPVLGGNASSEIRVGIAGADDEFRHSRETGIIEEIRIEDMKRNFERSTNGITNYVFDTVLLEMVNNEDNLRLHLNTTMFKAHKKGGSIEAVEGLQLGSETSFTVYGKIFIDCSGDGIVAAESGAEFRMGREGKDEFGEKCAPDKPDKHTMGSSLQFHVADRGRICKFTPPEWAYDFPAEQDMWDHSYGWGHPGPYVWIETGGDKKDIIFDNEKIMDELRKILYGVWDHIKNHGHHHAENRELDWIGSMPGKRESRRIIGDHILTESDILEKKLFDDRVAFSGWPLDVHNVGGFWAPRTGGHATIPLTSGIFSIPFRCYYSKNVDNLMMAGRNISVSHIALGGVRVIATCAVGGQAVGTAASLCIKNNCLPRQVGEEYIKQLQQTLLKDDCYLTKLKNEDNNDLALKAKASASSSRKLEVTGHDNTFEMSTTRAQKVYITRGRLDRVHLKLQNKTDQAKDIELEVIRADFDDMVCGELTLTHFGHMANVIIPKGSLEYPDVLAQSHITLQPGEKPDWAVFELGATLENGAYWLMVEKNEGIFWESSKEIVPGLIAINRLLEDSWSCNRDYIMQFKIEPASYSFGPENVNNGISRMENNTNIWISDPTQPLPQYVELDFGEPEQFNTVHLAFDTNLDGWFITNGPRPECVCDYDIAVRNGENWDRVARIEGNYHRKRIHRFDTVTADAIRILVKRTNGVADARIYEIRVYNENDK